MTPRTACSFARHPAPPGAGCFRLCALLAGALLAGPAAAEGPSLGSVEGGFGVRWLHYAETGPTGRVLDQESGLVPVASLAVELRRSRWFGRVAATGGVGDLRYDGHTQSTNPAFHDLPVRTTSAAGLLGVELRAGAFVDGGRRLALHAGAAWRAWDRHVGTTTVFSRAGAAAAVPALDEDYSWLELHGGVRCTLLRTARTEWLVDAGALRTVGGRVVVARAAGDVMLHLGDRSGGRVALAARVALGSRSVLVLEGHAAFWGFGASPVDATSLLYEPESDSRTIGLEAHVATLF